MRSQNSASFIHWDARLDAGLSSNTNRCEPALWTRKASKAFGEKGLNGGTPSLTIAAMTGDSVAGFRQLLNTGGLPELGPGPRGDVLPADQLAERLEKLLSQTRLAPSTSDLVRALVLLWHDHLDAAHTIAQGIENADGSFVHGIVHRREPDYSNARYWFRRVGSHEAFPRIAEGVERLLDSGRHGGLAKELLPRAEWDPFAFVGLCERASGKPDSDEVVKVLREIQGVESQALLDYFLRGIA